MPQAILLEDMANNGALHLWPVVYNDGNDVRERETAAQSMEWLCDVVGRLLTPVF